MYTVHGSVTSIDHLTQQLIEEWCEIDYEIMCCNGVLDCERV